jgi:hypothetical protein
MRSDSDCVLIAAHGTASDLTAIRQENRDKCSRSDIRSLPKLKTESVYTTPTHVTRSPIRHRELPAISRDSQLHCH